jgi:hypothetical protein
MKLPGARGKPADMEKSEKAFHVQIDDEAHYSLLEHAEFLARVSVTAARRLMNNVYDDIAKLDHNPWRFPRYVNSLYPAGGDYRDMVTCKRYKVIYEIFDELNIVQVVNIIDCRKDDSSIEAEIPGT